jgi:hypothetical protein
VAAGAGADAAGASAFGVAGFDLGAGADCVVTGAGAGAAVGSAAATAISGSITSGSRASTVLLVRLSPNWPSAQNPAEPIAITANRITSRMRINSSVPRKADQAVFEAV